MSSWPIIESHTLTVPAGTCAHSAALDGGRRTAAAPPRDSCRRFEGPVQDSFVLRVRGLRPAGDCHGHWNDRPRRSARERTAGEVWTCAASDGRLDWERFQFRPAGHSVRVAWCRGRWACQDCPGREGCLFTTPAPEPTVGWKRSQFRASLHPSSSTGISPELTQRRHRGLGVRRTGSASSSFSVSSGSAAREGLCHAIWESACHVAMVDSRSAAGRLRRRSATIGRRHGHAHRQDLQPVRLRRPDKQYEASHPGVKIKRTTSPSWATTRPSCSSG